MFAQTFAALDGDDGALLVHCTAGKDRTGLLAALIQAALGVHRDDLIADFLETNRVMLTDDRKAKVAATLAPLVGGPPSEAVLRAFLGVSAHHLDLAFAAIDAREGGLESYLTRLGATAARLERLRTRLLT